jgi:hypothetical protein
VAPFSREEKKAMNPFDLLVYTQGGDLSRGFSKKVS